MIYQKNENEEIRNRKILAKNTNKCNECDFMSTENESLRSHKQSTHKEVEYPCDKCDFKTDKKAILRTHYEVQHNEKENAPNIVDFIKRMRLQNENKVKLIIKMFRNLHK